MTRKAVNPDPDLAIQAIAGEYLDYRLIDYMRELYSSLGLSRAKEGKKTIALGSALYGEGTTSVAVGLAACLSLDLGRKTVVIEGDMARPSIAERYGFAPSPGLVDLLQGRADLGMTLRATGLEGFWIMPAGGSFPNSIRLAQSDEFSELTASLATKVDHVILDLPPLAAGIQAVAMAETVESVVLVIRAGATPRPLVDRAISRFPVDKFSGVVLNGYRSSLPGWLERLL